MAHEENPVKLFWDPPSLYPFPGDYISPKPSFESVLDTSFRRLREKHIEYSIRRIAEMDQELMCLEKELDDFLRGAPLGGDKRDIMAQ